MPPSVARGRLAKASISEAATGAAIAGAMR